MFDSIAADANLTRIEEEIRRFWQWYEVEAQVRAARSSGRPFRILQQPLQVTGQSWSDQIRLMAAADLIARYHALCGDAVESQTVWACHGLAVEVGVERALPPTLGGYEPGRFNAACRQASLEGIRQGEAWAERLGVWLDPASTLQSMAPQAVGSVWAALRRLWDAGQIRQTQAVVPVCPRCATPLSADEAAVRPVRAEARAVWIRLPWDGEAESYLLAWTEAPWMLVGMVALAAHPAAEYVLVEWSERPGRPPARLLLAEAAVERTLAGSVRRVRRLSGKALRGGAPYHPLFTFLPAGEGTGRVVLSNDVPLDRGTGLMPVTPAFDSLSLSIAQAQGLPVPELVDDWGELADPVVPWRGLSPLEAELLLVEDVRARGLLLRQQAIERRDARCPYCESWLLPLARSVWQVQREGGAWTVGRERTWGIPMPVWTCEQCGAQACVAGLDDLAHRTGLSAAQIDAHRPAVDRLTFACHACGRAMRRVSAVVDAHWEMAVLPWAGFPHADRAALAVALEGAHGWAAAANKTAQWVRGAPAWERVVELPPVDDESAWDSGRSTLSDALRWAAYTGLAPADAEEAFLRPLWRLAGRLAEPEAPDANTPMHLFLDRWLRASVQQAATAIGEALSAGDLRRGAQELADLLEALRTWYVPNRPGGSADALSLLSRLAAPFVPHLAEAIHRQEGSRAAESVHVGRWPQPDPAGLDPTALATMASVQQLAALGAAARARAGLEADLQLPRAAVGLLQEMRGAAGLGGGYQVLLAHLLGVAQVQVQRGLPGPAAWRLSLSPQGSAARGPAGAGIEAGLGLLDPAAATRMVEQIWEGFSVSVGVADGAVTLLPEEVEVDVEARPGWTAAAGSAGVVALELGERSG
jgi:isoleucyl-tRNA synthetase